MSQLKAIFIVVEAGGLSGRVLGERLGITPSAVTALVGLGLVQRGTFGERRTSPIAGISWARPTPLAQDLFERLHASHREQLVDTLSALSADELTLVDQALLVLRKASAQRLAVRRPESVSAT